MKSSIKIFLMMVAMVLTLPIAFADLKLQNIQYDPAIIAAGDEVDIVIQFVSEATGTDEAKIGDPDYTFKVILEADDTLTKNYVTIQDAEGDDLRGTIFPSGTYNKKFRVKVNQDAPAGSYEFKLSGQWYKGDTAVGGAQFMRFKMDVKKEGIILDVTTLETVPSEVRPGDNYVKLLSRIENVGEKDAKSVEINLALPKGIQSSYTDDNRKWVGRVNAGESKEVTFFVDIEEKADSKSYNINYKFSYMDLDNNEYSKSRTIPFLVKPRPYIEVIESSGEGLSASRTKLYVKLKNTGTESAEAVDVRILKQNSQPFTIDVRSDYIGELEPGEEGIAVFDLGINPEAEIKEHDFKLLIRSKGDSDEGDDNIYTYNRRAKISVTGKAPNLLLVYGIIGAALVVVFLTANTIYKKRRRNTKNET